MPRALLFVLLLPTVARAAEHRELPLQLELDELLVVGLLSLILFAVRQVRGLVTKQMPSGPRRRV